MLGRGQCNKYKESRKNEIIKLRVEINEIENKYTKEKNQQRRSWFFKKTHRITKALGRQIKKKEKKHITNIRSRKRDIIIEPTDTKK